MINLLINKIDPELRDAWRIAIAAEGVPSSEFADPDAPLVPVKSDPVAIKMLRMLRIRLLFSDEYQNDRHFTQNIVDQLKILEGFAEIKKHSKYCDAVLSKYVDTYINTRRIEV